MSTKQRYAKAETASWADLWGNAALALFKGIVGGLSGSKALLADAFRSAADSAAAFAALSRNRYNPGQLSQSDEAVKSHSKREAVTSILVSVVLLIIGLEIGIAAIRDITEGVSEPPHWSALAAIVAGIIVKEFFLPYKDRNSGLYSSLAALVGAGGALVGHAVELPVLYYLDPAAAVVIAVIVMLHGYRIITAVMNKEETNVDRNEDADELMQLIQRVDGVITVESLQAKEQGHYVVAEVVISVNPRITVLEGQDIAKRVKQLLLLRFSHVTEVTIYVEPYDPGYPYKSNHDPNQEHAPTLLQ
ncbi:MAG: cation diffusion facilitator family transporter [Candidatus Pristimantibacillus sp.]